MAYTNGTFQYFDDAFMRDRADYRKPTMLQYPSSTLFGYLQSHHPKWLLILQRAGRDRLFGCYPVASSYTLFVPREEAIPDASVVNMDISQAIALFDSHTMRGKYSLQALNTTKFQNLNTLMDGQTIFYVRTPDGRGGVLNRRETIVEPDVVYGNVILHIISGAL